MADNDTDEGGRKEGRLTVMPLGEHLRELRARLIWCLLGLLGVFVACWLIRHEIMDIIRRPHAEAMQELGLETRLKALTYFSAVVAQMKACLLAALLITSPLLIYQGWAFVAPGLFSGEQGKVIRLGLACLACLLGGVSFGYFLFVPTAFRFLIGMAGPGIEPALTIDSYLGTFFWLILALGIAFQTPVVIFGLVRWGVLDVESLRKHREAVILGAFVLGAILTPPDPVTQIMLAVTLIMLYDLGALAAAPSRGMLLSSLRFTGVVVLGLAAVWAYQLWWPAGRVTAMEGRILIGGKQAAAGTTVRLQRGDRVLTAEGDLAQLSLAGQARLYVSDLASVRLLAPDRVGIAFGTVLLEGTDADQRIGILTEAVGLEASGATAEVSVSRDGKVTVKVFRGEVAARTEGQTVTVGEGERREFGHGGRPSVFDKDVRRWEERIGRIEPR